jgi:hypothetical protein
MARRHGIRYGIFDGTYKKPLIDFHLDAKKFITMKKNLILLQVKSVKTKIFSSNNHSNPSSCEITVSEIQNIFLLKIIQ